MHSLSLGFDDVTISLDWTICENLREKSAKICGENGLEYQESNSKIRNLDKKRD